MTLLSLVLSVDFTFELRALLERLRNMEINVPFRHHVMFTEKINNQKPKTKNSINKSNVDFSL